jgi:hypothetical protein
LNDTGREETIDKRYVTEIRERQKIKTQREKK